MVQGSYPTSLLSLWDAYNDAKGSESIRPGMYIFITPKITLTCFDTSGSFLKSQTYAIILLPNGGPDLEAFPFATHSKATAWQQACSVFWQVTRSISTAEKSLQFEVYNGVLLSSTFLVMILFLTSTAICIGDKSW